MKRKLSLGKVLIGTGLLLIAIGLAYTAISFPWRALFGGYGNLQDPTPPSIPYRFDPNAGTAANDSIALPADNRDLPLERPVIDLVLSGMIKIPKIGISENIVEGTGEELLYGVGHLTGSASIGAQGNTVLSGHRNYIWMHPFKQLPMLEAGDKIVVKNLAQNIDYTYEVYQTFTVKPEDTWVTDLQQGETHMLTLITCTPFPTYTERYIVWARMVNA